MVSYNDIKLTYHQKPFVTNVLTHQIIHSLMEWILN